MAEAQSREWCAQLVRNRARERPVRLEEGSDAACHRAERLGEGSQRGETSHARRRVEAAGPHLLGCEVKAAKVPPEGPDPEEHEHRYDRELHCPVDGIGE